MYKPSENTTMLSAFTGYGIEIEYMIVDNESLNVRPITDKLIKSEIGEVVAEIEQGKLCWSNELVMHVLELKVNGPVTSLASLPKAFQKSIAHANTLAEIYGSRLMPTSMHPWMNPAKETRIWPYEGNEVYAAYDRIFNCRQHGWSNLQSVHINLPFADDIEFARLHAAIRLILPILPALAASSPFVEGNANGALDCRLQQYQLNQKKFPIISGAIIPETVNSRAEYEQLILQPIYAAIKPVDTDGILQQEWLNSRGAITRFDRQTIEIRLLDTQEYPGADLAIAALVIALVRYFYEQADDLLARVKPADLTLQNILRDCIQHGENAAIADTEYLALFGLSKASIDGKHLWAHIAELLKVDNLEVDSAPIQTILNEGTLASRILAAAGADCSRGRLFEIYSELCDCLGKGRMFHADF